MTSEPVAIVAADCLLPGGRTLDELWDTILSGRPAIVDVPDDVIDPVHELDVTGENLAATVNRRGGWFAPPAVDLLQLGVPPRTARSTDRSQIELLFLALRLMRASGYGAGRAFDPARARIAVGCATLGPLLDQIEGHLQGRRLGRAIARSSALAFLSTADRERAIEGIQREIAGAFPPITADSTVGYSPSTGVGRLANRLDFRGGYVSITTACAASLMSVLQGCHWLQSGQADLVLAGGVDYSLTTSGLILFSAARAISPTECLPFDARANGTVLGIGCALVLLKRLADARRDGDPVLAVVRGGGISSDGRGASLTQPTLGGITRMVDAALEDAGAPLASIQYVEAHGTGTPIGDTTELAAFAQLAAAHGVAPDGLTIGALKQLVGHSRAAAGVSSLIKVVLAMGHRVTPAMPHIMAPRAPLERSSGALHYLGEPADWAAAARRRALVVALGFGGINCGLVIEDPS